MDRNTNIIGNVRKQTETRPYNLGTWCVCECVWLMGVMVVSCYETVAMVDNLCSGRKCFMTEAKAISLVLLHQKKTPS